MLLALVVLGMLLGLSGRLLQRDPQTFINLLSVVTTIGPFLAAIVTLFWLGFKERRRRLLLWGALLAGTPVLGIGAAIVLQEFAQGPGGLGILSTGRILNQQLPAQWNAPWVWQELERRLQAGELTASEINGAILELAEQMKSASPGGWDQPLSWQRQFVDPAIASGQVKDETLIALADAFYGAEPTLAPLARQRVGDPNLELEVKYGNTWASQAQGMPALLWRVRQVVVDGKPVKSRKIWRYDDSWRGIVEGGLPAGEHELRIDLEAAYAPADQMVGLRAQDTAPTSAPRPLKSWRPSITKTLVVYPQDESFVRLLTKPGELRGGHGLRVERLIVQPLADGKKIVLVLDSQDTAGPDISFQAAVKIDDQTYPLDGGLIRFRRGSSVTSAGSQLEASLPSLISDAKQAHVILTPDPSAVERFPEVDAIWGKPVTLRGVPIERLDLLPAGESR